MARNVNDLIDALPAARRRKIERRAHQLIREGEQVKIPVIFFGIIFVVSSIEDIAYHWFVIRKREESK